MTDPIEPALEAKYRITEVIGEGGMGVVYSADHVELEKRVAIKTVRPELARDPMVVSRFRREIQIAARLDHPNLARVLDVGDLEDGRPFLVLEHVAGPDLATVLATERRLAAGRTVAIGRQLASAVDYIHASGVVHRDVKPENVLCCRSMHPRDHVKLIDFGLAREHGQARITAPGVTMGTFAFLPPEAWGGALPDRPGDVYGLATLLFEMLAGCPPFDVERPHVMYVQKKHGDPHRLTDVAPRWADCDEVFVRALSAKPEARQATAGELVRQLEAAMVHRPRVAFCDVARATEMMHGSSD